MKFSIKIEKDTFSPYIKQLQSKSKGGQMRAFMQRQHRLFIDNINETFRNQIYFNGANEESWRQLRSSTVRKRERRGTWYGHSSSVLKETGEFWQRLIASRYTTKRESNGYSASLIPTGTHLGYDGEAIKMQALVHYHQEENIRPPLSMLQETQDKLVSNFVTYFFS